MNQAAELEALVTVDAIKDLARERLPGFDKRDDRVDIVLLGIAVAAAQRALCKCSVSSRETPEERTARQSRERARLGYGECAPDPAPSASDAPSGAEWRRLNLLPGSADA